MGEIKQPTATSSYILTVIKRRERRILGIFVDVHGLDDVRITGFVLHTLLQVMLHLVRVQLHLEVDGVGKGSQLLSL